MRDVVLVYWSNIRVSTSYHIWDSKRRHCVHGVHTYWVSSLGLALKEEFCALSIKFLLYLLFIYKIWVPRAMSGLTKNFFPKDNSRKQASLKPFSVIRYRDISTGSQQVLYIALIFLELTRHVDVLACIPFRGAFILIFHIIHLCIMWKRY